ncbi:MAG: DinB family protein [Melioribacteraceae bacterium]|nr:DinB family protein [Melioribacteraceae bacterium]
MLTKNNLIDDFIKEFADAKSRVNRLAQVNTANQFNIRPAEGKWNAGDCLEHINSINEGYLLNVSRKLNQTNKSNVENADYKPRFLVQIFVNMMKPESKIKFKAPNKFKEIFTGNLDATLNRFMKVQDDFIKLAEKSREYDLKVKVPSPVTKLIKFQLGEMFMAMIEHQKRHLAQAERALKSAM